MSEQNNRKDDGYYDLLDSYAGIMSNRKSHSDNTGNVSFRESVPERRASENVESQRPFQRQTSASSQPSTERTVVRREPETRMASERPVRSAPATRAPSRTSAANTGSSPSRTSAGNTGSAPARSPVKNTGSVPAARSSAKKKKRKQKKLKNAAQSLIVVFIVIVVVILSSMILKTPIMGCLSDIVGINRSSNEQRVMISEGMKLDEIIDILKDRDLIYSSSFCKLAAEFLKYDKDKEYPEGIYDLSPDMGIETMLNIIIAAGENQNTVTITFPEGLTVDQIVEKLVENKVSSAEKLYEAMSTPEFYSTYSFLGEIKDSVGRARVLEGYLCPDTYEFYIGEDPKSVLTKFLDNFNDKWEEDYTKKANALGLTMDQIVTVASILEKEASDFKQMRLVASILYNRRNSPYFSYINCDSTVFYVDSFKDKYDQATVDAIAQQYDTYKKTGLPLGAICNPGMNAIEAALDPEHSDYYYFIHDKSGNMYVARTESEHQANMQYLD